MALLSLAEKQTAMRSRQCRRPHVFVGDEGLKRKARIAVMLAVRNGQLVRKPCEVCGGPKSEGHHEDYTKPLEVVWLCRWHHTLAHGLMLHDRNIEEVISPVEVRA